MNTIYVTILGLLLIGVWAIQSTVWILKVKSKGRKSVNNLLYDSIPGVFTSLGVLGTFSGILIGLLGFDTNEIDKSIPILLRGMQTAFITSVAGIVSSLVFSRISKMVWYSSDDDTIDMSSEIGVLRSILNTLQSDSAQNQANNEALTKEIKSLTQSIIGSGSESLNSQLLKLRSTFRDSQDDAINELRGLSKSTEENLGALKKIDQGLNGDGETSLLNQVLRMREEQNEHAKANRSNFEFIVDAMKANSELLTKKFDEFAELMAKNNTEALVEVMKAATEEFNAQMSAIIERLVQENFDELNRSVDRMNTWQQENKIMITQLTDQFKDTVSQFRITSQELDKVEKNTSALIDDNGVFAQMIQQLNEVLIEDTKLLESSEILSESSASLQEASQTVKDSSNELNNWITKQNSFNESYTLLMSRLEEIDKIKDINEVFWNDTKKQLEEGVSIISNGSTKLQKDLDEINNSFYERLNSTLQSLDDCIQRMVLNYDESLK
ncbi:hypothetical protein N9Q08_02325 [Schleiferiaceae bacterium]|nr:hypothetical protein [Schleiferiaceae bacterium]MDA9286547.1 hypothetical protein [Schleiferiaceae bacterium]